MDKITVIIPNYNNAEYLDKCINSVITQTYKNLEIICIDDKSTDNSLTILEKYKAIDKRIILISLLKNEGVSNARNIALQNATGNYVCFLDSDDYLEKNFCDELYKSIISKKSDLALGGHIKVNSLKQRISAWLPKKDISKKPNDDIFQFTKYRNVTQKLFKLDIIKAYNLYFDTELNYMEDAVFLVNYLTHCKSISGVKKVLYNVRLNPKSLCRNTEYLERRRKDAAKANDVMNKALGKK